MCMCWELVSIAQMETVVPVRRKASGMRASNIVSDALGGLSFIGLVFMQLVLGAMHLRYGGWCRDEMRLLTKRLESRWSFIGRGESSKHGSARK